MIKVFHRSNPVNRDSILKNGLLPSIGPSYEAHNNGLFGPVIFVSIDKSYDSTYDDDLFSFFVDKQDLFDDKGINDNKTFFIKSLILPELLTLEYSGSGNSTF